MGPMTTDADTLITRNEAAEILGVSPRTVSRYATSGLLKKMIGGPHRRNVRFRRAEVLALEDQLWRTDYTPAE